MLIIMATAWGKNESTNTSDRLETTIPVTEVKIDARKIGPAKSSEQIQIEEAIENLDRNKDKPAIGYWVGTFGKNKINIAIASVENGKASGYTVCAGNYRPITGTVSVLNDSLYS